MRSKRCGLAVLPSVAGPDSPLAGSSHIQDMRRREDRGQPAVTRPELIRRLADAYPTVRLRDIAAAVEILINEIAAGLARGISRELRNSGTFTPRPRRARVGPNPRTAPRSRLARRAFRFLTRGKAARPPERGAGGLRHHGPAVLTMNSRRDGGSRGNDGDH
jgi:integration host factor subunit beta